MKKNLFFILIFIIPLLSCSTQEKTQINQVPSWAKEAVWYQIFPERFANGDQSNDPQPIDMEGAWPYFIPDGWQNHPWSSDWYKLQPWEEKTGHDFYWNAGVRRYGGDLQGVINKLDYLKELGVNAIYLNPIFESPSLHKYDATYFHHVDNNFGPNPQKDREIWEKENPGDPSTWQWTEADKLFLKLIQEVHNRGMKIIIDGVFNHTGTQFWAFKDIVKNQQNSKFKDWYTIKKWDDPATPENEFEYEGWYGVKDLPEIKEDENGLVSGPREHVHAIVKRWMDPNNDGDPSDGIDGWRLDVAEMVKHPFWVDFRKWVREINPDAYITGEVWWEDWTNYKMFNASPWLQGDQFDAVMNYRFTRAVKDFALANNIKTTPQAFADTIKTIMNQYKENYYVMMNLLGSHDTERLASLAINPDGQYDHKGNPRDDINFEIRKPNEFERKKQMLAAALQFTMPGAPMIYYGDEVGMWGGDDPDCRKPMLWASISYETETTHPFGKQRPADNVSVDFSVLNWYKKLANIRNDNKALSLGTIEFEIIDNEKGVLAFKRIYRNTEIIIVVNSSGNDYSLKLNQIKSLSAKNKLYDLLNGKPVEISSVEIILPAFQLLILK